MDLTPSKSSAWPRLWQFAADGRYFPVRGAPGVVEAVGTSWRLPSLPIAFEQFLYRLPAPLPTPEEASAAWGLDGVRTFEALAAAALLEEVLVDAAGQLWARAERPSAYRPIDAAPRSALAELSLSSTGWLRPAQDGWNVASADSPTTVWVAAEHAASLVAELSQPMSTAGLSPIAQMLLDHGLLQVGSAPRYPGWGFPDAVFHAATVHGDGVTGYGARRRPDEPGAHQPIFPRVGGQAPRRVDLDMSFTDVLTRRRSCRKYSADRLSDDELGAILALALADQPRSGAPPFFHVYPSGGALGEIATFVVREGPDESWTARYDSGDDRLRRLPTHAALPGTAIAALCRVAGIALPRPSVALVFAADYARVAQKYDAIAYATILRNVGAIYQTVSLCAEALKIGSCCLGGGWSAIENIDLASELEGRVIVGAMLLGHARDRP